MKALLLGFYARAHVFWKLPFLEHHNNYKFLLGLQEQPRQDLDKQDHLAQKLKALPLARQLKAFGLLGF